jgi:hypothetical protein
MLYYIYLIMQGIVQKRSAMEIAKEVGNDIALKGIGMAAGALLNRAPWKMVFSLKLFVILKILSSEYQPYACGKIFRMPRF